MGVSCILCAPVACKTKCKRHIKRSCATMPTESTEEGAAEMDRGLCMSPDDDGVDLRASGDNCQGLSA